MRFRVRELGSVDSTNERALASIASGDASDGDVFVAREQTAGRGRRGATWISAPGEGLYASIALLPDRPLSSTALTMASALAVHWTLRDCGIATPALKWPNDVLIDGAKVAGILVETRGLELERPHYVVGIGINVRQREFPRALADQRAVTSLALHGIDQTTSDVLRTLLERLAVGLPAVRSTPDQVATAFVRAAGWLEHRVAVEDASGERNGVLTAFGLSGLELRVDSSASTRAANAVVRVQLEHVRALRILER